VRQVFGESARNDTAGSAATDYDIVKVIDLGVEDDFGGHFEMRNSDQVLFGVGDECSTACIPDSRTQNIELRNI